MRKNWSNKEEYNKSKEEREIKGKITKRTKRLWQELKGDKNSTYTGKDILRFYNSLCKDLKIPPIEKVRLGGSPYRNSKRIIWGFYKPYIREITLFNINPKRGTKKTFKSLSNSVLHELIHHYDLTKLSMKHSPHTSGFFARIIDLSKKLEGR